MKGKSGCICIKGMRYPAVTAANMSCRLRLDHIFLQIHLVTRQHVIDLRSTVYPDRSCERDPRIRFSRSCHSNESLDKTSRQIWHQTLYHAKHDSFPSLSSVYPIAQCSNNSLLPTCTNTEHLGEIFHWITNEVLLLEFRTVSLWGCNKLDFLCDCLDHVIR